MSDRKWYRDANGLKFYVEIGLIAAGSIMAMILVVVACGAFSMYADRSGCEQKQVSRPEIHTEWHWNTGCIILNPDQAVVVSR